MGRRDQLANYESSDPELKEISKEFRTEDETVDKDVSINLNNNDEDRINQHGMEKARIVNDDPAIREVSQDYTLLADGKTEYCAHVKGSLLAGCWNQIYYENSLDFNSLGSVCRSNCTSSTVCIGYRLTQHNYLDSPIQRYTCRLYTNSKNCPASLGFGPSGTIAKTRRGNLRRKGV